MIRTIVSAAMLAGALMTPVLVSPPARAQSVAEPLRVLVPAYFYPVAGNTYWPALNDAAQRVPLTVILNPASGPGELSDSNYVAAISSLRQAGALVIGYVHTSYGNRSINDVTADVQTYLSMYRVDGFFIDEFASFPDADQTTYYANIFEYIKASDADRDLLVIGNPGTGFSETLLSHPMMDAGVNFESALRDYGAFSPPGWVGGYSAESFGHLVYGARNKRAMKKTVNRAVERHAGMIYVTDDKLPNPWDTLPRYWSALVSCVESINAGASRC